MTQVYCVTTQVLKLLIYSTKSVDSLIDLEMLRLMLFCFFKYVLIAVKYHIFQYNCRSCNYSWTIALLLSSCQSEGLCVIKSGLKM